MRQPPEALTKEHIWTRGGDCEIVDGDDDLERVVGYITEVQYRMGRGKVSGMTLATGSGWVTVGWCNTGGYRRAAHGCGTVLRERNGASHRFWLGNGGLG